VKGSTVSRAGPTKANQALRSCHPPRCALTRIQMSVKVFVLVKTQIEALSRDVIEAFQCGTVNISFCAFLPIDLLGSRPLP
jgi:hypothetical protein